MNPRLILETILPHLGTIVGLALGFVLIARLMREKRRPSNTLLWLLLIVLVPYLGVPLFLLLGGRKIKKLSTHKGSLRLHQLTQQSRHVELSPFGVVASGNSCRFLSDPTQAYETLVGSIRSAAKSIDIATFILSHDAVGRSIVRELSQKAKQGLEVRLLVDAVGSFGKKALYMRELEKSGGQIERFMPVLPIAFPGAANLRNHRKIAVFDKQRAIIGGRNIGRHYMGANPSRRRWTDLGAAIGGPAASALSTIFEEDWAFARRKKGYCAKAQPEAEPCKEEDSRIEIMASGPDTPGDPFYEKVLSSIQEADSSVTIVTPYFIPDELLQRSLSVKSRTGKDVTIIVPKKSNHRVADLARKRFLLELKEAGASVLGYQHGMLHAKAMLIDGKLAMTGSPNMDLRSLFVNYEVAAFFYSQSDCIAIDKWIGSIRAGCLPIKTEELEQERYFKGLAEDLSRLIAPLL